MLKTVQAYHDQKDYSAALRILEENQDKITTGVWHYNVGTIQAKLENLPLARYHFMQAEMAGLSNQELRDNMSLVETKLELPKYEKPLSTTDYLVTGSLTATQGIFTLVCLLFVIAGIVALMKRARWAMTSSFFAFSLIILGLNWWIHTWNKVIVIAPQIVHEGPSAIFESRDELPLGVLLITTKKDDWLKIVYPSRYQGWIKDTGLKELK